MLGPSGCGKTTTLRMIAGFEEPTEGRVLLQGEDVTYVPPARRHVNMVFQAYALFPHMSVQDNVGFGLRIRKTSKSETRERVAEAIRSVRMEGFEDRRPGQLSGGQQQRVALARALVNRPAALLLDEPLGALDLKLRKEMQLELKEIQTRTGTTFVYVTHDQEEALTMSDRIAVMNLGVVEQVADPRELYEHPSSAFVAGFIGTSNLVTLRIDEVVDGLAVMHVGEDQRIVAPAQPNGGQELQITVRPEKIKLAAGGVGARASHVGGTVADVIYLGSMTQLMIDLTTGEHLVVHRLNDELTGSELRMGDDVVLHWAAEHSFVIGTAAAQASGPADEAPASATAARDGRLLDARHHERGNDMATEIGSMTAEQIIADSKRYTLFDWQAQSKASPLAIDRAEGVYMYGADGRRWLDFSSQLMGVNIGHGDKRVTEAIALKAQKPPQHRPFQAFEGRAVLGKRLAGLWPGDIEKTFFTLAGAEANENAVKIAKLVTGRQKVLARYRSYHGSTYGTMMLTGDPRRWPNEQPPMPGVVHVLDPYHGPERGFDDAQTALALLEETIELEGP